MFIISVYAIMIVAIAGAIKSIAKEDFVAFAFSASVGIFMAIVAHIAELLVR